MRKDVNCDRNTTVITKVTRIQSPSNAPKNWYVDAHGDIEKLWFIRAATRRKIAVELTEPPRILRMKMVIRRQPTKARK